MLKCIILNLCLIMYVLLWIFLVKIKVQLLSKNLFKKRVNLISIKLFD